MFFSAICNSIRTVYISTIYKIIIQSKLKDRLKELVQLCSMKRNGQCKYKYLSKVDTYLILSNKNQKKPKKTPKQTPIDSTKNFSKNLYHQNAVVLHVQHIHIC